MKNMELRKEYVLVGATLIDGNGSVPAKDTAVVVKNGVIEEVGDSKSTKLEHNIQEVDLHGYCLMPGLIDAHAHLAGAVSDNWIDTAITPKYLQVIRAVAHAKRILEYGFTTVRSAGSRYDVYLKRAVEEGTIPGPRIMACGLGLRRTGAHPLRRDLYGIPDEGSQESGAQSQAVDGVEEIRKAIRKLRAQNVDHIKFFASGTGFWEKERAEDMQFSMEEMKMIVDEAHMGGLPVMAHAVNLRAVKALIELGVDSIEHGSHAEGDEYDEEMCKEMAEKGIFLTPTLSVWLVGALAVEKIPEYVINSFRRAIKNGVKVLLGGDAYSDSPTPYGKHNIGEIKALVDLLGLTPLEAITAATKFGAEVCRIGDKIGTIERGKLADLLVVRKDPSSNIDVLLDNKNIKYIIKEGSLVIEH